MGILAPNTNEARLVIIATVFRYNSCAREILVYVVGISLAVQIVELNVAPRVLM